MNKTSVQCGTYAWSFLEHDYYQKPGAPPAPHRVVFFLTAPPPHTLHAEAPIQPLKERKNEKNGEKKKKKKKEIKKKKKNESTKQGD